MSASCKYPHVTVKLSGKDNTFYGVVGDVRDVLRAAGVSEEEIDLFSGDAVHAGGPKEMLDVVRQWVTVK